MLVPPVMRWLFVLVTVTACQSALDHADTKAPGNGGTGDQNECVNDRDCVAVGPTCCACPTFAVPVTDPAHQSCKSVVCPPSNCDDSVHATCSSAGTCVLTCEPVVCPQACPDGYAIGPSGCLSCACAVVAQAACASDGDCVRVPADCCGCAQGGADTAVPADQVATYEQNLGCTPDPQCPGKDTCTPGLGPHCVEGACELVAPLPPSACGRADLPACSSGKCTVNVDATASAQGVGVCM